MSDISAILVSDMKFPVIRARVRRAEEFSDLGDGQEKIPRAKYSDRRFCTKEERQPEKRSRDFEKIAASRKGLPKS